MRNQHIISITRILGIFLCFIFIAGILFEQNAKQYTAKYYKEFEENIISKENQPNNTLTTEKIPKERQNEKQKENSENELILLEENYIYIKDTNICYPLMQGTDNKYYLTHLPDGKYSSSGSIFMDYQNKENDFNTIIYGHNMKNDTMFGQLSDYYTINEFANNHSEMIICRNNCKEIYQLFSVQRTEYDSNVYYINPDNKENWIDTQKIKSIIDFHIDADENDKFITLSTCGKSETEKIITIWIRKTEEL